MLILIGDRVQLLKKGEISLKKLNWKEQNMRWYSSKDEIASECLTNELVLDELTFDEIKSWYNCYFCLEIYDKEVGYIPLSLEDIQELLESSI